MGFQKQDFAVRGFARNNFFTKIGILLIVESVFNVFGGVGCILLKVWRYVCNATIFGAALRSPWVGGTHIGGGNESVPGDSRKPSIEFRCLSQQVSNSSCAATARHQDCKTFGKLYQAYFSQLGGPKGLADMYILYIFCFCWGGEKRRSSRPEGRFLATLYAVACWRGLFVLLYSAVCAAISG